MTTKIDGSLGVDRVKAASVDQEDLKWVPANWRLVVRAWV